MESNELNEWMYRAANDYHIKNVSDEDILHEFEKASGIRVVSGFVLGNGDNISIQASKNHHCYPRETFDTFENYTHFEVYFRRELITLTRNEVLDLVEKYGNIKGFYNKDA